MSFLEIGVVELRILTTMGLKLFSLDLNEEVIEEEGGGVSGVYFKRVFIIVMSTMIPESGATALKPKSREGQQIVTVVALQK